MARWVAETTGKRRVGIQDDDLDEEKALVRFGPDGPRRWKLKRLLRPATREEIAFRLGCRVEGLPPYYLQQGTK